MYAHHKNSHLQGNFENINPGLLNRVVQKAFQDINNTNEHNSEPSFNNRLTSEQPHIPVENVDVTKRPEGLHPLRKLRHDLHNKDPQIVVEALTTISDLVHDPEKCYESINLKIVDRLTNLLVMEDPAVRERTAHTLKIIAGVALGKEAIVNNTALLQNLLEKIEDEWKEVRLKVAACLRHVASFWRTADVLVKMGFIQVLLTNLCDMQEVVEVHLDTLRFLFYCDGKKIAIEENGFHTLIQLLNRDEGSIIAKALEALTELCNVPEGRKLAKEYMLLKDLNRLLYDERPEVYTVAAEAIIFCTIKSSEKITASKFISMPKRLVQLSRNKLNSSAQLFSIKALTSLCEHPEVRRYVIENHYKDIENIQLSADRPEIQQVKNILMTKLQWLPHKE